MMSGPDPDSNSECQKKNKKKQKQKSFTLDDYRRRPTVATKTQSTLRENGAGLKQRTVCYAGFSLQFDFLSIFYSSILLLFSFLFFFSIQKAKFILKDTKTRRIVLLLLLLLLRPVRSTNGQNEQKM